MYAFLLVLARVGGAVVFVPLPEIKGAPEPVRDSLRPGIHHGRCSTLLPVDPSGVTIATLAGWAVTEAAIGLAIGICVAIVLETFTLAAQILGLQAGLRLCIHDRPHSRRPILESSWYSLN